MTSPRQISTIAPPATATASAGSRPSRPAAASRRISTRSSCSCPWSAAALYPLLLPNVADLIVGDDTRTPAFATRYRATSRAFAAHLTPAP